jgi:transcriptional regulator with XRE-family HTH domain
MTDAALDPLNLSLGRAIRKARLAAQISMRTLAARCGVSQPFLSEEERGLAMPSIATLYRVAEALGVAPATLLPTPGPEDIHVVRADEGRRAPSSERPHSAVGRVIYSDEERGLELFEYITDRSEDLDVWFAHAGVKVLYVADGRLAIDFESRPTQHLGRGDCIVHPADIPHRWQVEGDEPVRVFLAVVRGDAATTA